MQTPIVDFIKKYARKKTARFHMPGHKGKKVFLGEKFDITEIDGADNLSAPFGIIKNSQDNTAKLFGAEKTYFSTAGSSLSIKAMLSAFIKNNGERPVVFAGRNAHKAFIHSAILLDFEIKWLYGEDRESYLSCQISPEYLERVLSSNDKPTAVYITSPDYLGNIADIKGLNKVCSKFNVPLLVDNAHGAYLKFLSSDIHPITLGATACVDSAHKTLPVLTGGGYLHFSSTAKKFIDIKKVQNNISLFSSSSPSYLIMASLDNANKILDSDFSEKLNKTVKKVLEVKNKLINFGVTIKNSEPLKIVIDAKKCGYTAFELNELLLKNGVVVEFYDEDYLTLMVTPFNKKSDYKKLIKAFKNFTPKKEIEKVNLSFNAEKVLSPKQAYLLDKERVKVEDANGKILADISYSCPPAVPIAIIGERIDSEIINALKYYKVEQVEVIKE